MTAKGAADGPVRHRSHSTGSVTGPLPAAARIRTMNPPTVPPPIEQGSIPVSRGPDRRRATLRALWVGNFHRRRMGPRRGDDRSIANSDWHHPQWLAVSILILLMCIADALLTLTLMDDGASELNPVMEQLLEGPGRSFALWKIGLTASGVVVLVLLARLRTLGRIPVGAILYVVLGGYGTLIAYELWLLSQ